MYEELYSNHELINRTILPMIKQLLQ